ncbi:MAG TPA: hypothetical protein VFC67_00165 [Prolixibacteraceae bacterium]|nr:hypothetical protein [Prolixibacteraceae bacterium]
MSVANEGANFRSDEISGLNEGTNFTLPDLTYLKDMAAGDESFVVEIITYFVESCPDTLHSMRECALSGDHEKLRFLAHTLLPQLTFVGILAAIPYLEKIESEIKLNDDLFVKLEKAINIINYGIEDLKKMI